MQDTSFRVKNFIYYLYCAYDDAFSGDDAQQLSCSGSDEASGHYGRDYFAGSVFHLSGVSDVPFFQGLPEAIMDSARIDGAGELRIFFRIGIPLGSPGMISALVLGFLEYWNLIEQPMAFLKTKEKWPLSLYLPNISTEQAGTAFAASVLVLLPAVLVFLAGQDYLEHGIVSTAVKE